MTQRKAKNAGAAFGYAADAYLSIPVEGLPDAVEAILERGATTVGDLRVLGYYLDAAGASMVPHDAGLLRQVNAAALVLARAVVRAAGGIGQSVAVAFSGSWALQDMLENLAVTRGLAAVVDQRTLN